MMTRSIFTPLLVCMLVIGTAGVAWAGEKYYRWVDENGQVHFGERPQEGAAAEELQLRAPGRGEPGNILPAAGRRSPAATEQGHGQNAPPPDDPSAAGVAAAERKAKCQLARAEIATYSSGRRLRVRDKNGEVEYLTEEKRAEWLVNLRKAEEKFCD